MIKPKTNFTNFPYSDSYTDIDRDKTILQIGNSDYYENIFKNNNNYEYIETICELVPEYLFNNIEISMNYRNEINESINKTIKYNLYNNSIITNNNIVSGINIVLNDTVNIVNDINEKIIYTKYFGKQNKNIILETNEKIYESGIDTISNAYLLGGKFSLNNIQQYLFYINHNYNETPSINIISAEDAINNSYIKLDSNIKLKNLSTLQDDIINGEITIIINNNKYRSLLLKKFTLISNKVNIIFKIAQ